MGYTCPEGDEVGVAVGVAAGVDEAEDDTASDGSTDRDGDPAFRLLGMNTEAETMAISAMAAAAANPPARSRVRGILARLGSPKRDVAI
jgi:hypothetical protein